MHRKIARFLSLFLSASMMMGSVSLPVLAEEAPAVYAETAEEAAEEEQEAVPEEEAETEEAAEETAEAAEEAAEEPGDEPAASTEETVEAEEEASEAPAEEDVEAEASDYEAVETETAAAAEEAAEEAEPDLFEETEAEETAAEEAAAPTGTVEEAAGSEEEVASEPVLEGDVETPEVPATGAGYVLMNIPYAKFYEAEGTSDVDAVSSSTKSKTRNNLAAGSYHVNADGSDISGVIYPVFVEDLSALEGFTKITEESSVEITVTGRGEPQTTTYTGKDALFEAPDYAYYVLDQEPALYKTMNADGSFSAVNAEPTVVNGAEGDVTYAGRHTDIEIKMDGLDGISNSTVVSGVVVTADGVDYGMRHVYNIWRGTELGWNDDELDLYGKTITNIRYFTQSEVLDFPVEIALKKKLTVTASFKNATSVALGGVPADIENAKATVSSVVGRGETAVVIAEDADIANGYVTTAEAAVPGTSYNVKVVSDNYADATVQAAFDTKGYVLMNIPYADFYAAEGIDSVDAVSTATVKTYNQTMAGGSYHAGYEAADPISGAEILGVIYPVYVEDLSALEGMTQVTDADEATITVAAGKSSTTTKDVSGKDLLFASGSYAYYILGEEPANYKTLSGSAGSYSFSAVQNGAQEAQITSAALTYGGHYTDLTLDVEADEVDADAVVTGVVLTAGGVDYALRHVENVWRKTSLGWNWTDLDGAGLSGKTITAITYYLQDGGIYKYTADIAVKKELSNAEAAFTAANTIAVKGLPEDIENPKATVSSVVGRGETAVVIADDVDVADGVVTTTDPAVSGTKYNVKVVSDNYADATVQAAYEELKNISIGGTSYYYTDVTGDLDNTLYQAVVSGRGGSTTYNFVKSDLTQVGETGYAYTVLPNATPLSGTLYGYGEGTASNYKEVYAKLGAATDTDPAYDAVTSATGFSGHHAGDIPKLVTYGTAGEEEKAITGLLLNREVKTVDAVTYVEASILNAEEKELTDAQKEAITVTLKVNPMTAPSETEVAVKLSSAALTTSRYGVAEFAIVPDDTVEGYVWSEYWGSVYAATISDGTTTVGAVHWIDLYGESATSGAHYNKVEIALNNGTSVASNQAEVSRYAAFFDGNYIKSGTYTITVYAEGYAPLTAQVEAGVALADKTVDYTGEAVSIDETKLTGIEGEVAYTYYEDEACTKAMDAQPVEPGTYYVKAVAANLVSSEAAKLTIQAPVVQAKGIKLPKTADLAATKTLQLKPEFDPANTTERVLTWTSNNTSVATVDKNGKVKALKYGKAVITAKTSNGKTASCTVNILFKDVANAGKSYFQPVYWAVNKGITVCTVNFRPEDSVTRGEFVAFLWRLAGKPKSSAKVSFKDVNSKTKFYDAIRWAVGAGIIKGYSDKTFKPENNVTRGETATMIWRYAGKKTPKTKKSPFSDIKVTSADSCKAILWGSENGIIKGSGGKFLKNDGCTRGQVVTFLYRYANK